MIIIYLYFSIRGDDGSGNRGDKVVKIPFACKNHRMASLARSVHEDDPDSALKFLCNGIITDINTVRIPKDCFSEYSDERSRRNNHFITSGSRFWPRGLADVHSISNIRYADDYDSITVTPPFDKCVLDEFDFLDSYANQSVIGWDAFSRQARSELEMLNIENIDKLCSFKPGALVIGPNGTFKGLVKKRCLENDTLIVFPDLTNFIIDSRKTPIG